MGLFSTDQEKANRRVFQACDSGNIEKLRAAIAAGGAVNGTEGRNPLGRAVYKGHEACVKALLEAKADPNVTPFGDKRTPLMEAVSDGRAEIAELLIRCGADTTATSDDGWTALHYAAHRGRGNLIKLLLENGADPNATDNRMNTAADLAQQYYPRLADLLRGKQSVEAQAQPITPAAPPQQQEEPVQGWQLTARDEVSNITEKAAIGYRLTEIFNFGSGIYTRIARNLQTGAESQSLRFFDEFSDRAALDRAQEALTRLGGDAPDRKLGKASLPAPRPQGGAP